MMEKPTTIAIKGKKAAAKRVLSSAGRAVNDSKSHE